MNLLKQLDILSIFHFLIYFIIGLYFKGYYKLILFIGVLWELFEKCLASNKKIRKLMIQIWPIPIRYWNDSLKHSVVDIIINMIGYYIGNQFNIT